MVARTASSWSFLAHTMLFGDNYLDRLTPTILAG